ncbi:MAG: hypothetical protein B7Z37_20955 [Verrucomicrobia bacterium 12-59-8]|nr:MAG: hypothetical protein B7Z37_20955 [Verrucomicrobia bacterium 12-59-8]
MNVKTRQRIEKQIARLFLRTALAAGYAVSLDNGGEDFEFENSTNLKYIIGKMFATDEERLYLSKNGKRVGWVLLVYGNDGYDVICDYTTNLEHLMPEVEKLSDKLCEQYC